MIRIQRFLALWIRMDKQKLLAIEKIVQISVKKCLNSSLDRDAYEIAMKLTFLLVKWILTYHLSKRPGKNRLNRYIRMRVYIGYVGYYPWTFGQNLFDIEFGMNLAF